MREVIERESVATGITLEVEELQRQNQDSFRVRFSVYHPLSVEVWPYCPSRD
jgi:hypothetical protein